MKAAYLLGPKDLQVVDRPIPVPAETEVLIRVKTTAICGTDVAIYNGQPVLNHPVIQGHESAGIIEEVGAKVNDLKAGQKVIINPAYSCGDCFYCRQGLQNLCASGGLLGRDRDGSFAEYVTVPSFCAVPLPDSISFDDASTLQSLATVLRGWEKLESVRLPKAGDVVVVIGLGTPGLLMTRLAVLTGATVVACTRSQWKLDIAAAYGAKTVNPAEQDLKSVLMDLTDGRGADFVFETAGKSATFGQAIDIARPGAVILCFGILHSLEGIDPYYIYFKELTIVGTRAMNTKGYKKAIQLFEQQKIDLSPLITDYFELDDIKENFEIMNREPGKHLRMVCRI